MPEVKRILAATIVLVTWFFLGWFVLIPLLSGIHGIFVVIIWAVGLLYFILLPLILLEWAGFNIRAHLGPAGSPSERFYDPTQENDSNLFQSGTNWINNSYEFYRKSGRR